MNTHLKVVIVSTLQLLGKFTILAVSDLAHPDVADGVSNPERSSFRAVCSNKIEFLEILEKHIPKIFKTEKTIMKDNKKPIK